MELRLLLPFQFISLKAQNLNPKCVQVPPSPLVIILKFGTRTQNTLEAIAGQPLVLRERADLP